MAIRRPQWLVLVQSFLTTTYSLSGNQYPGQYHARFEPPWVNEPDYSPFNGWYYKYNNEGLYKDTGNGNQISDPIVFTGTLKVYGLQIGGSYSCVRYDSIDSLPTNCNFLFGGFGARYDFIVRLFHDFRVFACIVRCY
jgi:hypothetical protein